MTVQNGKGTPAEEEPGEGRFEGRALTCVRGDRTVFTGLSFHLAPGDALLVKGPNGAGKSSLLRMVAGLMRPWGGHLLWDGVAVEEEPEIQGARSHYVGHHDAVKPVLSVAENLRFWGRMAGSDRRALPDHVRAALTRLGLWDLRDLPGRFLSSGQRRRLNLARLLVAPRPLWLLDEPTVGLDKANIAVVEILLAEHRAAGGMVMVSTHTPLALPEAHVLDMEAYAPAPVPVEELDLAW